MFSFLYMEILLFTFVRFSESSVPPDRGSGKSGNSGINELILQLYVFTVVDHCILMFCLCRFLL